MGPDGPGLLTVQYPLHTGRGLLGLLSSRSPAEQSSTELGKIPGLLTPVPLDPAQLPPCAEQAKTGWGTITGSQMRWGKEGERREGERKEGRLEGKRKEERRKEEGEGKGQTEERGLRREWGRPRKPNNIFGQRSQPSSRREMGGPWEKQ